MSKIALDYLPLPRQAQLATALIVSLTCAPIASAQNNPGTTPQGTSTPTTAAPAGTTPQTPATTTPQGRPGALPPARTDLPPNAGTTTTTPNAEAQRSTQPQPELNQQRQQTAPDVTGPQPISPQIGPGTNAPGGLPQTATPAGTPAPAGGTVPGAVGAPATGSAGVSASPGQGVGTAPSISPAVLPTEPPAIAPNYEAPRRALPSAERVGVDVGSQTPLTLNEAIRLALANNNDIEAANIGVRQAEFDLTAARGIYDPLFSSESFYERSVTPVSSLIGGGPDGSVTQTNATGALRFGGFSPFAGGSYQLDFASTRLQTNNQFVVLNPQFPTALTLTYTQPLWRGLRFDQNRRNIEIAKRNISLTDAQFRQRVIDVIAQVESAYWDLAAALRNLQVQIEAVRQARTQVESNQRQVQAGILAPIDIVAADAQVTNFEQNVYAAQEAVTRSENALKALLLPDRLNPLWSQALVPVTPIDLTPPPATVQTAVETALTNRPELAQLETTAAINEVNARFFREQTKPQIDIVGTYNPDGLAGTFVPRQGGLFGNNDDAQLNRINELSARAGLEPLPVVIRPVGAIAPNLIGSYGQSIGNLLGQDYPTFRVGVRLQLPLKNRTAEANLGRALAESALIRNQRAQAEQLIEADVRNTLQSVRSAEARLASAAASRVSAEQQYASEQRQLAAGLSTVFLVLQRQQELVAARARELQAQTDLNKAITNFQRAVGNTLTANNVAIRTNDKARRVEVTDIKSERPLSLTSVLPQSQTKTLDNTVSDRTAFPSLISNSSNGFTNLKRADAPQESEKTQEAESEDKPH